MMGLLRPVAIWTLALAVVGASGAAARPAVGTSEAALAVRASFAAAFARYAESAWGHDVLSPKTGIGRDRSASGSLGVTLVDALDALWVMGFDEAFERGAAWVEAELRPGAVPIRADVEEASGRVLGGLLGAFASSGDARLLRGARALGDRLLPAWTANDLGAPLPEIFDLSVGVVSPAAELGLGPSGAAAAGLMELRELGRATGRRRFWATAEKQLAALLAFDGRLRGDALTPDRASVTRGSYLAEAQTTVGWGRSIEAALLGRADQGPAGDAMASKAKDSVERQEFVFCPKRAWKSPKIDPVVLDRRRRPS